MVQLRSLVREVDVRLGNSNPPTLFAVSQSRGVIPRSEITEDPPRAESFEKYKLCSAGDLVLNRFNAYRGALGVAPTLGIVSPDYLVLRPNDLSTSRFVEYFLKSDNASSEMLRSMGGLGAADPNQSGFSRIDVGALLRLEVPIADSATQALVADWLDDETSRVDDLIHKQDRVTTLLRERRQALISAAVTGQIHVGGAS